MNSEIRQFDVKQQYIFYYISDQITIKFIGKINSNDNSLSNVLENYKIANKNMLNINNFIIQPFQLNNINLLTEVESIIKKNELIEFYIKQGIILENILNDGVVYKLVYKNIIFYIGSTLKSLQRRFYTHFNDTMIHGTSKVQIFIKKIITQNPEEINAIKIVPIFTYKVETRTELNYIEQLYYEEFQKLELSSPTTIQLQNTKNAVEVYNQKQKDKIQNDSRKENRKLHYQANIQMFRNKQKERRELQIQNGTYKFECFYCKIDLVRRNKNRHDNTINHCTNVNKYNIYFKNIYESFLSIGEDVYEIWYNELTLEEQEAFDLWKANPTFILQPNENNRCSYCKENFDRDGLRSHIRSKKHSQIVNEINNIFMNYYYQMIGDKIMLNNWYNNLDEDEKESFDLWIKNPQEIASPDIYHCDYCNEDIAKRSKYLHDKGETHTKYINEWHKKFDNIYHHLSNDKDRMNEWIYNLPQSIKNMYIFWCNNRDKPTLSNKHYCAICNSNCPLNGVNRHIKTNKHLNQIEKYHKFWNLNYQQLININTEEFKLWYNSLHDQLKEIFNIWYNQLIKTK